MSVFKRKNITIIYLYISQSEQFDKNSSSDFEPKTIKSKTIDKPSHKKRLI